MKCLETFCYRNIPCSEHKGDIEGWEFGISLYSKNTTAIILTKRKEEEFYNWIIKCMEIDDNNETSNIQMLSLNKIQHSVEFPEGIRYYGNTKHISWYVMKFYPRVCYPVNDYNDFHLIMRTCLEFVRDLHIKTQHVYMDWRLDNILKKKEHGFVIADYEFLEKPHRFMNTLVEDYIDNKDYIYYFLQRGGNLDKPLYRYRFDLESIGFLAIEFLQEYEPLWFIQCTKVRQKKMYVPLSTISEERDSYKETFISSNPCLQLYFQKIKECSWDSLECMPIEWYNQLITIFHS
jgi:hypothetical protein